jgi:hypothetical protein
MEKILELALKSAPINTKNLMRIFKATGNAQVATEIALGIFEEPEVPYHCSLYIDSMYHDAKLVEYNPFTDEVRFSYTPCEMKRGWVPKGTKNPTTDDFASTSTYSNSAAGDLGITTEELEEQYDKVSIVTNLRDYRNETTTSLSSWTRRE